MKIGRTPGFVFGLGSGIFCTALVGYLFVAASGTDTTAPASAQVTDTMVQTYLKQNHMVAMTQKDLDKRLSDAQSAGIQSGLSQKAKSDSASPKTVWIYIPSGSSLTDVANLLMAAGVISDGNELIRNASGRSSYIRSGIRAFPVKGSLEEIIGILTSS